MPDKNKDIETILELQRLFDSSLPPWAMNMPEPQPLEPQPIPSQRRIPIGPARAAPTPGWSHKPHLPPGLGGDWAEWQGSQSTRGALGPPTQQEYLADLKAKEAERERLVVEARAKEEAEAAEIERLAVEARAKEEADRKAKEAAFREQILGRRKSMEDERNRRERAKRLAEALGGITRFGPISSAQILLGQEAKPFKSKAHDRRLAELDRDLDPIYDPDSLQSRQDRKFFSDTFGVEVGEGASSASLRQAFPAFRDTMGQRFSADQQEKREASAGKRQKQRFTHEEEMAKQRLKETALTTLSKQKAAQAKERKAHEKEIRKELRYVRDRVSKDPSHRRSVEAMNDARMVLEQLKSEQGDGDKAALRVLKEMWDKSSRGGMYQSKLAARQPQIFENFTNWWSNISTGTISEKKREQMVEAATTFSNVAREIKKEVEGREISREAGFPEGLFYEREDVLQSFFGDPGEDRAHEDFRALFQGGEVDVLEGPEQE